MKLLCIVWMCLLITWASTLAFAAKEDEVLIRARAMVEQVKDVSILDMSTGCYARASIMAGSLLKEGIEAFQIFGFGNFTPKPGVHYTYHAAAAFKDGVGNVWVVDPILSQQPLAKKDWVVQLRPSGNYTIRYTAAGHFGNPVDIKAQPKSFPKSKPHFKVKQLLHHCRMLMTLGLANNQGGFDPNRLRQRFANVGQFLTENRFIEKFDELELKSCVPYPTEASRWN